MFRFQTLLVAAVLLAAGCSSPRQTAPAPTPSPVLRNPLGFALYPGARILSTHSFRQIISAPQDGTSVFTGGAGAYGGLQVIAESAASFEELSAWTQRLGAHPPKGFIPAGRSAEGHSDARRYGFDFGSFTGSGKRREAVLVIVLDPLKVDRQFGSVLGMIAHYRSLPAFMRKPVDDQVKARLGITLSEAVQPESPIGATLAALDEFEHRNARGIVAIEASRL